MDLVGMAEVVELLGRPRSTINRWLKRNEMPETLDKVRATPVWRRDDILRFRDELEEEEAKHGARGAAGRAKPEPGARGGTLAPHRQS